VPFWKWKIRKTKALLPAWKAMYAECGKIEILEGFSVQGAAKKHPRRLSAPGATRRDTAMRRTVTNTCCAALDYSNLTVR
jgi:hypothetical protein